MTRLFVRPMLLAALLAAAVAPAGCVPLGYLASIGGDKVPAVYELAGRTTLVMVDDPHNLLGNPQLRYVIGTWAGFELTQNDVLEKPAALVPQQALMNLATKLSPHYAEAPVDQVGRALDADQVIHVVIQAVQLESAPGMFRPTATVAVKVVDAGTGERLFPKTQPGLGDQPSPGYPLKVQMKAQVIQHVDRATQAQLMRSLAERLGRSVAELFYKHPSPTAPGSTLK